LLTQGSSIASERFYLNSRSAAWRILVSPDHPHHGHLVTARRAHKGNELRSVMRSRKDQLSTSTWQIATSIGDGNHKAIISSLFMRRIDEGLEAGKLIT